MPNVVKDEIGEADASLKSSSPDDVSCEEFIDSAILGGEIGVGVVAAGLSASIFGLLPTAFVACGAVLVGWSAKTLGRRLACHRKLKGQKAPSPH